jgi:hypothetical protein
MGCDIHLYFEKKYRGKWVHADKIEKVVDRWTDTLGEQHEQTWYRFAGPWDERTYGGRNYDLFAVLANVRNGFRFAGCDTGDAFVPIAMPKGLPDDVSGPVKKLERDCPDWHSHSWLTLRDLQDYDFDRTHIHRGYVSENGYRTFLEKGYPDSWNGDVMGETIIKITNEQMTRLIGGSTRPNEEYSYYTQLEWETPYRDCFPSLFTKIIPRLEELSGGDPDAARIVFWFDN